MPPFDNLEDVPEASLRAFLSTDSRYGTLALRPEDCHVEHLSPLRPLGPEGLRELVHEVLGKPLSSADATELQRLEEKARTGNLTLPGTMIVTCPKP